MNQKYVCRANRLHTLYRFSLLSYKPRFIHGYRIRVLKITINILLHLDLHRFTINHFKLTDVSCKSIDLNARDKTFKQTYKLIKPVVFFLFCLVLHLPSDLLSHISPKTLKQFSRSEFIHFVRGLLVHPP